MIVRRLYGVALATALGACNGGSGSVEAGDIAAHAGPAPTTPQDGETPKPEAPKPAACRDWSDLDVSKLPPLPKTPHAAMFEQVWRRVLEKHFDPTIGCLDWPALRLEYGQRLGAETDVRATVELLTQMLGRLEQSHFAVSIAGQGPQSATRAGPGQPPIEVRVIDNHPTVVQGTKALPAGALLVSVGGQTMAPLLADLRHRHGLQTEFAFRSKMAIDRALSCQPGASVRVVAQLPRGGQVEKSLPCALPKGVLVTLGNLRDVPARVEHRMIESSRVGYLSFNIWMLQLIDRVRDAIGELRAKGMEALVLDLRGNPGGVGPMAMPVARMLLPGGGSLGTMQFREFTQEFAVAADTDAFTGPIAVLVDEGTASTSEIFTAGMRDLGRIRVFGAGPSAGAALPSIIEELEGGVILQYVVGDYHSPNGTAVEGRGVVPDVLVPETRADFIAGGDPVLDAAAAALSGGTPR